MNLEARNEIILSDIKGGQSCRKAARRWGLSGWRGAQIARQHGVKSEYNLPITLAERRRAQELLARGVPLLHIAEMLGRSRIGLRDHLIARGLFVPQNLTTPWSASEERTLLRDYGNVSASKIAAKLNRTKNEIIGKAHRMGLSKPIKKAA